MNPSHFPRAFAGALALALWLLGANATAAPVPRIIGGHDATAGTYPFMAALVRREVANDFQSQFCGATLIESRWVLTAAHCVDDMAPEEVQVIIGVQTLPESSPFATRADVEAIRVHPLWDSEYIRNDVALLYLTAPVTDTGTLEVEDGTTLPSLADGSDATAIGWGLVRHEYVNGEEVWDRNPVLQETVLDYVSRDGCNRPPYHEGEIRPGTLCVVGIDGERSNVCFGDSGGPLLIPLGGGRYRQIGVTSWVWNYGCAKSRQPSAYADVGHFHRFLSRARTLPAPGVFLVDVKDYGVRGNVVFEVRNSSPIATASGVSAKFRIEGDLTAQNFGNLPGCTVDNAAATAVTCAIGDLAPLEVRGYELELRFDQGRGELVAEVSSTGDDDIDEDDAWRADLENLPPASVLPAGGGNGGSLPWATLLLLPWLALRRVTAVRAARRPRNDPEKTARG